MKRKINFFALLIIIPFMACDDILEEDISDDSIQIVSPQEGAIIEGNNVQFLWNELEGADDYRVQVLSGSQVVVDSLVSSNQLIQNLNEGSYQWRVKGENFAYETEFNFPVNFSVEETDDLTNQSVVLLTPSANIYTNNPTFTFTWNPIAFADSYSFELVKNLNGETTIFQESNITSTSISLDSSIFDVDAEYIWKVKAINMISESNFSTRNIYLDRVIPNQPVLNSPSDDDTSSFIVTFNWSNGSDTGNIQSTVVSTLEISTDSSFSSLLVIENTQNNSYQHTFSETGEYYWRVGAYDQAGNQGDNSIFRTLTIEE